MKKTVVVVGITKWSALHCVGALDVSNGKSVRLLTATGAMNPPGQYALGEIHEVVGAPPTEFVPPHYENFWVTSHKKLETVPNLKKSILQLVKPWSGPLSETFENTLGCTQKGNFFVEEGRPLPSCSTGFWVADDELTLDTTHYKDKYGNGVPYKGIETPMQTIAKGTLVRLSLAGMKQYFHDQSPRAYMQLSGWY